MWSSETTADASGDATIRNVDTGEEWTFTDPGTWFPGLYLPPFLVVTANGDATDFRIIDTETGEEALVSEMRGGPFSAPMRISQIAAEYTSRSFPSLPPTVLLFSADEAATYPDEGTIVPDDAAAHQSPNALYLPRDLDDAGFLSDHIQARYVGETAYSVAANRLAYLTAVDGAPAIVVMEPGTDRRIVIDGPDITVDTLPLMFSENGSSLVVSRPDAILAFDLSSDASADPSVSVAGDRFMPIAHNAGAMRVLVEYPDGHLAFVDASTGEVTDFPDVTVPPPEYVSTEPGRLSFANDVYPLFDDAAGTVRFVDLVNGTISPETPVLNPEKDSISAAFQPEFSYSVRYPHASWPGGYAWLDAAGALQVASTSPGGASWSAPAPEGFALEDNEVVRLFTNPDATCLVLEIATEHDLSAGGDARSDRIATWIMPLAPGSTWTPIDTHVTAWFPMFEEEPATLPAQDFATPAASPAVAPEDMTSCASPGYLPIVTGDPGAVTTATLGGRAIVSTEEGVTVPLPSGETRRLPPNSIIYPGSDLAIAHVPGESALVTRLSDGQAWELPAVSPRVPGETHWDAFSNGRYVIGPTDDSRSDWLILDTATGETRTTSDILGEPFDGSLEP
jgi:hypothetical protein